MNKQMRIILCLVMFTAVILMIVCTLQYIHLGRQCQIYETQLTESRNHWEQIASEKEILQSELKTKKEELKEAELSFDESTTRAEDLTAEIETLRTEIEELMSSVH